MVPAIPSRMLLVWIFASGCLALRRVARRLCCLVGSVAFWVGCGVSNKLEFNDVDLCWPGLVRPSEVGSLSSLFPIHQKYL
jgi:hypothetical protein